MRRKEGKRRDKDMVQGERERERAEYKWRLRTAFVFVVKSETFQSSQVFYGILTAQVSDADQEIIHISAGEELKNGRM